MNQATQAPAPAAPSTASPEAPAPPLRILVRRIYSGQKGESVELRVYCPERGRTMAIEDCASCPRCQGFSLDPTWRNSFLMCRTDAPPREPAPKGAAPQPPANPVETPVSAIMSRDVLCVTPDLTLEALASLFLQRGVSGAPVVDEAGRPIGMVTKTDLVRRLHERTVVSPCRALHIEMEDGRTYELGPGVRADWLESATVQEIMMPLVFSMTEDTSIARAAALMTQEGVHRIAIRGAQGDVVGLLSAFDLMRWIAEHGGYGARP